MEPKLFVGYVRRSGGRALVVLGHHADAAPPPGFAVRATSLGAPVAVELQLPAPHALLDPHLRRERVLPIRIVLGPIPHPYLRIEVCLGNAVVTATEVDVIPDALPQEGFVVAAATCFYDYFAGGASSYGTALRLGRWFGKPGLAILAGDNLYMDVAPDQRALDDPWEEVAIRYARYFNYGAYADAIGGQPTIVTWDDHELWNNYPEAQPHLSRSWTAPSRAAYGDAARAGIERFQAPLNPTAKRGGFQFDVAPLSFYVADGRTERTPVCDAVPRMMAPADLAGAIAWLRNLRGPGVFVFGQPLWMEKGDFRDWNPPAFEAEYAALWSAIADAPYDVMILTGDVHHSRVLALSIRGRDVYEVVTSPAVHIPTIWTIGLGTYGNQDHGTVEYPGAIEVDPRVTVGPSLDLRRPLLFGHAQPNTLAFLSFRPAGPERVDVSVAFVDHATGDVAPSIGGGACLATPAFSLRKR
jgi:hypothetical protein